MSQFYARVHVTILDSSIAEDFRTRHIFEDFLKVCSIGEDGGVVDMTRAALARRFNVPIDELNLAIAKLEAPDPQSRDQAFEGRRLQRLDEHRDWGWKIINWPAYDKLRTRADAAARLAKHRANKAEGKRDEEPPAPKPSGFTPPTREELDLHASKIGLPAVEVDKFVHHYTSNGWMVGKNKIKSWQGAMSGWKVRWEEKRGLTDKPEGFGPGGYGDSGGVEQGEAYNERLRKAGRMIGERREPPK